jgi:phage-related protein
VGWENVKVEADRLWQDLQDIWNYGGQSLKDIWNSVSLFFTTVWDSLWEQLKGPVVLFYRGIVDIINGIGSGIWNTMTFWLNLLQGDWDEAWQNLENIVSAFGDVIQGLIAIIAATIWMPFAAAWGLVVGIWQGAKKQSLDVLRNLMTTIAAILTGLWDVLVAPFRLMIQGVIDLFKWLYDVLVGNSIVPDLITAIADWFGRLPGMIFDAIGSLIAKVVNFFQSMFNSALSMVQNGIGKLTSLFASIPGRILSVLGDAASLLLGWGQNLIGGLVNGIQAGLGHLQNVVGQINNIVSGLPGVGGGPSAGDLIGSLTQNALGEKSVVPGGRSSLPVGPLMGNRGVTLNVEAGAFSFPNITDKKGIAEEVEKGIMEVVRMLDHGVPSS